MRKAAGLIWSASYLSKSNFFLQVAFLKEVLSMTAVSKATHVPSVSTSTQYTDKHVGVYVCSSCNIPNPAVGGR